MNIVVSQQNKKLLVIFNQGSIVDNCIIDKSDEFLGCVDKFLKKRKMKIESLKKANLSFENIGMLTERIIRAIIAGLRFSTLRVVPRRGK